MREIAVLVGAMMAACFAPAPQSGLMCAPGDRCPQGLECIGGFCLAPGSMPCMPAAETCNDADDDCDGAIDETFPVGDACTVGVGACQTAGTYRCDLDGDVVDCIADAGGPDPELCDDGIDQDCDGVDPPCPENDLPAGAIDVSGGGTFTADVRFAHDDDDGNGGCGAAGGRDVFYQLTVNATEVVYLETFGSDYDTVVRGYSGDCVAAAGSDPATCSDDSCGGRQTFGAEQLAPGTYCIVIDQNGTADTDGQLAMRVVRTGRPGSELPDTSGQLDGTTTGAQNLMMPECEGDESQAADVGYWFLVCPGDTWRVQADTCTNTMYDSWLVIRHEDGAGGDNGELACLDDSCGFDGKQVEVEATTTDVGLHWIIVDGWEMENGPFTLTWSITAP
jgi:hypothetical protein